LSVAEDPVRRQGARRPSHIEALQPDNRLSRISKPSLERIGDPGTGRRSGSKPTLLLNRALRWLGRAGKTLESTFTRFLRRTGRLNATQPGILAVSTFYIRGLTVPCK